MRIKRDDVIFVAVDFQEKLMPAMAENEILEEKIVKLSKGLKLLGVPVIVTQQYTKGLGNTIPSVAEAIGECTIVEKTSFSACGTKEFVDSLEKCGRKTVILAGIESHICVQQTALDLLEMGNRVVLVADCVSSRDINDKAIALQRIRRVGVTVTTYESVLYELLGDAKAPEFKGISQIVK